MNLRNEAITPLFPSTQTQTKQRLAIIGCARSGIEYTSSILQNAGIHVGFESLQQDGIASWFAAADDQEIEHLYDDGNYRPVPLEHFSFVVHQTRHPLDVIDSLMCTPLSGEQQEFVQKHFPHIRGDSGSIMWGMYYWFAWCCLCDSKTKMQFRVENMYQMLPSLFLYTKKSTVGYQQAYENVYSRKAAFGSSFPKIKRKDLENTDPSFASHITILATQYGYEI